MGHEEQFPPPRLSARYGFRKETIAGMHRNGRDAPKAAVCGPEKDPNFLAQGRPLARGFRSRRRGTRKCVRAQSMTATASISTRKSGPAVSFGTSSMVLVRDCAPRYRVCISAFLENAPVSVT